MPQSFILMQIPATLKYTPTHISSQRSGKPELRGCGWADEKCVQILTFVWVCAEYRRCTSLISPDSWVRHTAVRAQRNVQSIMVVMICVSCPVWWIISGDSSNFFHSTNCKSSWEHHWVLCSTFRPFPPLLSVVYLFTLQKANEIRFIQIWLILLGLHYRTISSISPIILFGFKICSG